MPSVGRLLAEFRKTRYLSQLDLSHLAEISTRHLSFVENGRSQPSREMLLRLADVMDLPLRDCNLLLSAGGFAMIYSHQNLDAAEMAPVREALTMILENHNPYPALVMDGAWNVLLVNRAQERLLQGLPGSFTAEQTGRLNLLELLFDADGFRPVIGNWDELAGFLLRRLKKQVQAYGKEENRALFSRLLSMAPPPDWAQPPADTVEGPMITAKLALAGRELKVFSTLTHFGSALDVGLEELIIESYFPADAASRAFFLQLAQQ